MKSVRMRKFVFSYFLLFTFLSLLSGVSNIFAQEILTDVEPPPLRVISKEEITKLEAEKDVKGYTKTALLLMEARLKRAETFSLENQYQEMYKAVSR